MDQPDTPHRQLHILLAVMSQSPFNRSIWTGIMHGFQQLGHSVALIEASRMETPAQLPRRPDLLFAIHGGHVPAAAVQAFRDAGIRSAVYLLDEPYEVDRTLTWSCHYEHIFTVDRVTIPVHSSHAPAHFLPLAYHSDTFGPEGARLASDVLVLGSPFSAREEYLTALRDHCGGQVTWVGPGWKRFSPRGTHIEQYVTPPDCARFYRGAGIVINIHRDSYWSHFGDFNSRRIAASHLNPRFWEAGACHSMQLCSYREDLDRFAPDTPCFSTVTEFMQRLDHFLGDAAARAGAADRLYKAVRPHTYTERCRTVLQLLGL